ncbi:MAG: MBOAT family protein [Gemmataceae bacterium]|nr:MBOAT family protein [Gemmataceae bacterium]
MVFTSPVFLFLFLPAALAAVWLSPRQVRLTVLLLASLFFYTWGEKGYVFLIAFSILLNYALGRWIESLDGRPGQRRVLIVAVALNLATLLFFKYTPLLLDTARSILHPIGLTFTLPNVSVHLPIGISFFTFEAISYLVDVRRGTIPATRSPIKLGVFLTLFPHLVAGPIVRYGDISRSLDHHTLDVAQAARGVRRFIIGLSKKLLLANPAGRTADLIFGQDPSLLQPSAVWLGAVCYTLQIYFDFSGYSDMAIGLGRMIGFELSENFHYPYVASSVTEFWRRWHISLSSWFRDYVYIPLGGNRRGPLRTALNLLTVFSLCGLWHGASWSFLIWGWHHGLFLILERWFRRWNVPTQWELILAWPRRLYMIVVVMIGWIFFRADNLSHALALLRAAVDFRNPAGHPATDYVQLELAIVLGVGWIAAMPLAPMTKPWRDRLERMGGLGRTVEWLLLLALASLCLITVVGGTYDPFIYFRF